MQHIGSVVAMEETRSTSNDLALDVVLNEGASTDCCSEVPPPVDCDGYCFFEVGFFDNEPCLGGIWVVPIVRT